MNDERSEQLPQPAPAIPQAALAWIELEQRAQAAEASNIELEKENAVLANELSNWKQRCRDAEHRRDHYARYAVELLTRVTDLKRTAERLAADCTALVEEAKHATFKASGSGLPAPTVPMRPEDEQRVQELARKFAAPPLTDEELAQTQEQPPAMEEEPEPRHR